VVDVVHQVVDSPLGALRLYAEDDVLVGVYFPQQHVAAWSGAPVSDTHPVLVRAARELEEYFTGEGRAFTVPLRFHGTDFQRSVWTALTAIPYGAQRSYTQIAVAIGQPQAVRAVGAANGSNPLSIIVPCHRVVAGDGALTGYAGGLLAKRWLLEHEQKVLSKLPGGQMRLLPD
jgi:methylated-DNA-[protein]-cysteine S-methyltransferase